MLGTDIHIIFWIMLGVFTLGAAGLATYALTNVIRLRNVRLSWKAGKLRGYPLFATLFMASALAVGSIALYQGAIEEIVAAGLYTWLGVCWFTTSYFATKRFITDYGIVKNVNEPSQTVPWHQIRDFVEKEKDQHIQYIFIYGMDESSSSDELVRLELDVPRKCKKEFQKLISHKLGNRIRCYVKENIDIQSFKRP
jgi:hypothetical protein